MHDEDGHLGAVFRGRADAFDFESAGIDRRLDGLPHLRFPRAKIEPVNRGSDGERGEIVKGLLAVPPPRRARARAEHRRLDVALRLAGERKAPDLRRSVGKVRGDEIAAHDRCRVEHVRFFRDDLLPIRALGPFRIDGVELVARGAVVGAHVDDVVAERRVKECLDARRERREGRSLLVAKIAEVELVLRPLLVHTHDEPSAVGRNFDAWPVGELAAFAEDIRVLVRVVADAVVVDRAVERLFAFGNRALRRVAGVIKRARIRHPGDRSEARPLDLVLEVLFLVDVAQVERALFVAVLRKTERDELAVVRGRPPIERRRAVGGERVGIDEDFVLAAQAVAHVEDRLVLVTLAARVEIATVPVRQLAHDGRRDGTDREQLGETVVQLVAIAHAVEHAARQRVLLLGPAPYLVALAIFEPAVGVGDRMAEQVVDHRVAPGRHG